MTLAAMVAAMEQEAATIGTRTSLRDRSRQLDTREILQTALGLFVKQGYDEAPITQIVRKAGVSQRTLFR